MSHATRKPRTLNYDETHEEGQPGALALCSGSGFVSVADIFPFWRYAVGPTSQHTPAIPFYRLAPALAFFDEAKRELPWAGVTLYRRRFWRGVETLKEYIPNAADQPRVCEK